MTGERAKMDDASRRRFEEWFSDGFPGTTEIVEDEVTQGMWQAWQACDTVWRERLQSEEMVDKLARVADDSIRCTGFQHVTTGPPPAERAVANIHELAVNAARAVINAILEDENGK